MAVYRFRVSWEENEDVFRDIEIKSGQTFEDFHITIQEAFKFDNKHAASFFVSDDYWRKNQEITLRKEDLPLEPEDIKAGVDPKKLMAETKIAKFIDQPHQRFVYVFDPNVQWSFLIEMLKIAEDNPKTKYPAIVKSFGTAPKQYKQINIVKDAVAPENEMAALLADLDIPDEEVYKTIDNEETGVEEEDLQALEGEEGEDSEEETEDEFGSEDDHASDFDDHDRED
jgi:hypothetical protein